MNNWSSEWRVHSLLLQLSVNLKLFLIEVIFKTKRAECFSRSVPPTGWCLDQHHYLRLARKANVTYSDESITACQRNFARLRSQRKRETIKVRINMQICLLVSRETQAQGGDRNPRRIKSEALLAQTESSAGLSVSILCWGWPGLSEYRNLTTQGSQKSRTCLRTSEQGAGDVPILY